MLFFNVRIVPFSEPKLNDILMECFPIALALIVFLRSYVEQRLVADGARHVHPIHLGDEHSLKELDPVEVNGSTVVGIPVGATGQVRTTVSGFIIQLDGLSGLPLPKSDISVDHDCWIICNGHYDQRSNWTERDA